MLLCNINVLCLEDEVTQMASIVPQAKLCTSPCRGHNILLHLPWDVLYLSSNGVFHFLNGMHLNITLILHNNIV
ncbi:hypothetical protein C0J52_00379 [Blattella germanica]|nr:hypothetical protein C0J52_00379 [Blattella germanica]